MLFWRAPKWARRVDFDLGGHTQCSERGIETTRHRMHASGKGCTDSRVSDRVSWTECAIRLKHNGGRLVRFKLQEGRTIRVLLHACDFEKPILSLGCLAKQKYWIDLRADTGTLYWQDNGQIQLRKKESLFCVKRKLMSPLTTTGVNDYVARELHMSIGPQALTDVDETMPSRHSR